MKLSVHAKGLERPQARLAERILAEHDARLREAAEALGRRAGEEYRQAAGADAAIRVEPMPGQAGYSVAAEGPRAWELEFGSRARAARSWFARALTAARPAIKAALRRRPGGA